jgi:hypothetical protein
MNAGLLVRPLECHLRNPEHQNSILHKELRNHLKRAGRSAICGLCFTLSCRLIRPSSTLINHNVASPSRHRLLSPLSLSCRHAASIPSPASPSHVALPLLHLLWPHSPCLPLMWPEAPSALSSAPLSIPYAYHMYIETRSFRTHRGKQERGTVMCGVRKEV